MGDELVLLIVIAQSKSSSRIGNSRKRLLGRHGRADWQGTACRDQVAIAHSS